MAETCKSCGKAWADHLGVEPTCALLIEAVEILEMFGEPVDCNGRCIVEGFVLDKKMAFLEKVKSFASASENQANAPS